MLPRAHRVRRRDDFSATVRSGRRAARPTLVLHYVSPGPPLPSGQSAPARAGFVVSRAVGNAVTRNAVRRRLRELVRSELPTLPAGSVLVVRALPAAASARTAQLHADLMAALTRVQASGATR
jgi:ribonuclease P protein component